jgi:site-specific DNA recombinase
MNQPISRKLRCAIYTRKSSEEGLDQEFNSLDAQREAALAYIQSQRELGWVAVEQSYDDGGVSGGTLDRPGLQRLLKDIELGRIDVIVVYKVDRLSRSLMDFARLVEVFDRHSVSFVSVTQHFNTTNSMGRLTLNILLSFAQFEREVIGERIRDKHTASRQKGIWMGGTPPLGYDAIDRKLIVNEAEAEIVRRIFERFIALRSCTTIMRELNENGIRKKSWQTRTGHFREGKHFCKQDIYRVLHNRLYIGEAVHKDKSYPGEHKPIIDLAMWEQAKQILSTNAQARGNITRGNVSAPLRGLVQCGCCQSAMVPSHTRSHDRKLIYRYYVCSSTIKRGKNACDFRSISAGELEAAVLTQVKHLLRAPQITAKVLDLYYAQNPDPAEMISEKELIESIHRFEEIWEELYPAEQNNLL